MSTNRYLGSLCSLLIIAFFALDSARAADQFLDRTAAVGLGGYVAGAGDNHGPGGAFVDLNGDDYPELVLPTGGADNNAIVIYRNDPNGSGRIFTRTVLVQGTSQRATGIVAGDYDNDGDLDLYVTYHPRNTEFPGLPAVGNFTAPNKLFRNNGNLSFTEMTGAGVADAVEDGITLDNSLTAAWADVDRDGDLDLFVGNHNGFGIDTGGGITVEETPADTTHPSYMKAGQRDILYINNGNDTFTDQTVAKNVEGFENANGVSIEGDRWYASTNAVIFADFNDDGWPDLLVSNKTGDLIEDMLYINLGLNAGNAWRGFRTATWDLHNPNSPDPLYDFPETIVAPMGVDAADYDNDGDLDFYLTTVGHNDLFINRTRESGLLGLDRLDRSDVDAAFSWGTKWLDVNNDGLLDLHVSTNGANDDFLYIQSSGGFFSDQAANWGAQNLNQNSRADLAADYDRDGDLDLFVINQGASVFLENQVNSGANQRYLALSLHGLPTLAGAPYRSNRSAVGARAYVTTGGMTQMREVASGSGNAASSSDLTLHFGVGNSTSAEVEVEWPSGRVQNLGFVSTNQRLEITEAAPAEGATLMGEAGTVRLTHQPATVQFQGTYANPVVLTQTMSYNGSQPSVMRITDVKSNQFTVFIDEAPNMDGAHTLEEASYIVLEAGDWTLPNGTRLQVGTVNTSATVGTLMTNVWQSVNFTAGFSAAPVVISQVQSNNDSHYVKTRHTAISAGGFSVAMEREESNTAPHGVETIGYMAIEAGSGFWGSHPFSAGTTANVVTDAWHHLVFSRNIGAAPHLFAALATYNGADASTVRYSDLTRSSALIKIEEDTTADAEVNHTNEVAGYLAIGAGGRLAGTPQTTCNAPNITSHPTSQTVNAGANVTFNVSATGSSPLGYQWRKNGINIGGATSASLNLFNVDGGDEGVYSAVVSNACGSATSNGATLTVNVSQSPFNGTPAVIPGTVQTEAYDLGGEGVAYHDTTAGNTGGAFRTDDVDLSTLGGGNYNVGWTAAGEWLEYTVNVTTTGYYDIVARVATVSAGKTMSMRLNGALIVSNLTAPDADSWGDFEYATAQGVFLTAGNNKILRLEFNTGGLNVEKLDFVPGVAPQTVIAADDFNGVATGSPLNNRITPIGGKIWDANAAAVFGTKYVTATGGPNATIPHPPGGKLVTVEADVDPTGSSWVAVGFTQNINNGWWADGQVWVNLRSDGKYRLLANGTSNPVTNTLNIPNYVAGAHTHGILRYDPAHRNVELILNGVRVLAPTVIPGGYVPQINHAGWSALNSTLTQSRVDNFHLRSEP